MGSVTTAKPGCLCDCHTLNAFGAIVQGCGGCSCRESVKHKRPGPRIMKKKLEDLSKAAETAVNWLYNISHQSYFNGDRAYLREVAKNLKDAVSALAGRTRKTKVGR